ncbi:LDL receptor domain-containing protein [Salinisphaera sp. G21_0]|uniref:LDL receptor domain-containing protein n=1 Tax=Salinisphaera sp. G21_0 TaxID=2821094 RepID=UPI001AD9DDBD|nr:LDL receptor domain-containing protein [Salinisphaera sp. G21_0]MBO9481269.1 hypothetical protein [Salinisphaera sp. G21_0]
MISQSAVQSTGAPIASGSVPDKPTENGGLFAGFLKVVVWGGPILFLRSLHPGYIPPGTEPSVQPDEGPAFTFGSPDGQDSSFFQGVELGARLVSPYTVLPAETRTMLEGIVTFSAATRLRYLLGAFGATKGSPPEQSRADSPVDGSPTNDKGRKKKTPQQVRQRTSPPAIASVRTGLLPKAAVALGALSGLTAAGAQVATAEEITTSAHTATSIPTTEPQTPCDDDQFRCDNGQCISAKKRCDWYGFECDDGSDEVSCTRPECEKPGLFFCDSSKCLPSRYKCDGTIDCKDGSDENCTQSECENLEQIFCGSGKCISFFDLCEGSKHCDDGLDKRAELCNPVSSSPTPPIVTATPSPVTETMATASNTTMEVTDLPGGTIALPASAAPLAISLGTGAIAGITLGASAFVLAGVCIYRHCYRRSSAADDPQELVTINTVGQAQQAIGQPMIEAARSEAREKPFGEDTGIYEYVDIGNSSRMRTAEDHYKESKV